jgi:hypothetical protein
MFSRKRYFIPASYFVILLSLILVSPSYALICPPGYPIVYSDCCKNPQEEKVTCITECESDYGCTGGIPVKNPDTGENIYVARYCDTSWGYCLPKACSVHSDCPSDTQNVCYEGYCHRTKDRDNDGIVGTMYPSDKPILILSEKPSFQWDRNDTDPLCSTEDDCMDGDGDGTMNCLDVCFDKDNDGSCDKSLSIKKVPEEEFSLLDDQVKDRLENEGFEVVENDKFTDEMRADFIKYFAEILSGVPSSAVSSVLLWDCDDNNANRNLSNIEDNSCNHVDDDCDGQVDECSDWLPPADWDRHSPVLGVNYTGDNAQTIGYSVVGIVPESGAVEETGDNKITGFAPKGQGGGQQTSSQAPSPQMQLTALRKNRSCVYIPEFNKDFKGCHVWDFDGDGFKNASFGCVDCIDCNDFNDVIKPDAMDDTNDRIDQNCNGVDGEMGDGDHDGIPDSFDICDTPGLDKPIDYRGCWFAYSHIVVPPAHDFNNLPRSWSIEP